MTSLDGTRYATRLSRCCPVFAHLVCLSPCMRRHYHEYIFFSPCPSLAWIPPTTILASPPLRRP
ncbi:hypothetical protein C8Q78DRAFT_1028835 [Trametes maxima]|nr:hypothetical protein C8Q78DRAFT_1028835 [Trametes maxima]